MDENGLESVSAATEEGAFSTPALSEVHKEEKVCKQVQKND